MLIILEGPDLAGKTTLALNLQVYLAAKYPRHTVTLLHKGPPTDHPLNEYVTPLINYRPGDTEHIICDRWHLGEIVYPRVTGRPTQMTPSVRRYIEMFLQSRGATIVHVTASRETLTTRYESRGDDVQSLSTVLAAAAEFEHVMQGLILDYRRSTFREPLLGSAIAAYASRAEEWAKRLNKLQTYVGPAYPSALYVGDVRACATYACKHKFRHSPLWPAFGPYPSTSGEYLMQALPWSGSFGLVNINDVDREEDVAEFITRRPHVLDHVIALGRLAQKTLRRLKIDHTAVSHPQYVRRFHHSEVNAYHTRLSLRDGRDHITWPIATRTSSLAPAATLTATV